MFNIGKIKIEGDVFLSPMSSVTDSPFRRICRNMGSGFSFTEFVSADALVRGSKKSMDMFRFHEEERPIIFQIFGNEQNSIVEAAKIIQELSPDVIDLNMGCSVKKISRRGAGAGLLLDPPRAGRIINAMKNSLQVPVTAKIRLGWDNGSRNYREVAGILEDSGASMISVHGRTKTQGFKGIADWDAIGEIKSQVQIPVLGNGDIQSYSEGIRRKKEFGVDGVLIGRSAIGNPWIFSGRDRKDILIPDIFELALKHFQNMCDFYERGHVLFRKHATRYFKGFEGASELRDLLVRSESPEEFKNHCLKFLERFRF